MKFGAHAIKSEQVVASTRGKPPVFGLGERVVVIPEANAAKNNCSFDS